MGDEHAATADTSADTDTDTGANRDARSNADTRSDADTDAKPVTNGIADAIIGSNENPTDLL